MDQLVAEQLESNPYYTAEQLREAAANPETTFLLDDEDIIVGFVTPVDQEVPDAVAD